MGRSAELFRVVRPAQAYALLAAKFTPPALETRQVDLLEALGSYLAEAVTAHEDVPAFPRSIVDGYAVRARDTFGSSEGNPAYLNLVGEVQMGAAPPCPLKPGQALAIPTGGMLPEGADAVVMIEYTQKLDDTTVEVTRPAADGQSVVSVGEDVHRGQQILPAGRRLRAGDLGTLACLGYSRISVYEPVRVGILSSGNEVVPVTSTPGPGQVRDVNSTTLAAQVLGLGGAPVLYPLCPDVYDELAGALEKARKECDVVLVSGGSSVGEADYTARAIESLGEPGLLVHGIAVKPGKPTIIALAGETPVFGLPGHPVSAMDLFNLVVAPTILSFYGAEPPYSGRRARLSRNVASVSGREDRIRITLEERDGETWAQPVLGRSGLISLMARAQAIAVIPFESEGAREGEWLKIEPL